VVCITVNKNEHTGLAVVTIDAGMSQIVCGVQK
jgi:hypothetical protein